MHETRSSPPPSSLAPSSPEAGWARTLRNSKNPKEEIRSEYCPLSEDGLPSPGPAAVSGQREGEVAKKREVREVPVQPVPVSSGLQSCRGHGLCGDPSQGRHPLPAAREVWQGGNPRLSAMGRGGKPWLSPHSLSRPENWEGRLGEVKPGSLRVEVRPRKVRDEAPFETASASGRAAKAMEGL